MKLIHILDGTTIEATVNAAPQTEADAWRLVVDRYTSEPLQPAGYRVIECDREEFKKLTTIWRDLFRSEDIDTLVAGDDLEGEGHGYGERLTWPTSDGGKNGES